MHHHAKAPVFASNFNWVTSRSHMFRTRDTTEVLKNMIAEMLVRNDTGFRQTLRQCKDKWILAVTVGHDTISMKIYDPAEVDDLSARPMSSSVNRELSSFFEINRELEIRQLTPERVDRVMQTHPMIYADRNLKPAEVTSCDSIMRSMSTPITYVDEPEGDGFVDVDIRPDRPELHLEFTPLESDA